MKQLLITLLLFSLANYMLAQQKPNIVLLFVDDYGWADVGYRNSIFQTPNIDQLKKESLDFNRAYIPTPTCSPSRASLLTGKEAVRMQMVRHIPNNPKFGFTKELRTNKPFSLWPKDPVQMKTRNWLPLEEVTYAERLKEYGYYNMFIGKWHLGHEPYHPIKQGFDNQYGTSNAGHPNSYYPPFFKHSDVLKNVQDEYLTDHLTDYAVDFISNYNKKNPFMLSFWYYNVHGPFVGHKKLVQKYLNQGLDKKFAQYAAMVEAMDNSVGKIREAINNKGIADNTIILFVSDQGGAFSNAPLSGGKKGGNTLGEGGARVPFIINYPGITKPNTVSNTPIQTIDVFPTLMEIASGKKECNKNIQGKSLMPILEGKNLKSRNLFFFRSYEDQYAAVINGDWKLIKYHSGLYKLFNITTDEGEQNDLINTKQKKAKQLKKALQKWEDKVIIKS